MTLRRAGTTGLPRIGLSLTRNGRTSQDTRPLAFRAQIIANSSDSVTVFASLHGHLRGRCSVVVRCKIRVIPIKIHEGLEIHCNRPLGVSFDFPPRS